MKMVESLAKKYIKKGMHLGDNDPEKKGLWGEDGLNKNKYLGYDFFEILEF